LLHFSKLSATKTVEKQGFLLPLMKKWVFGKLTPRIDRKPEKEMLNLFWGKQEINPKTGDCTKFSYMVYQNKF
jgi:hypothetical protein